MLMLYTNTIRNGMAVKRISGQTYQAATINKVRRIVCISPTLCSNVHEIGNHIRPDIIPILSGNEVGFSIPKGMAMAKPQNDMATVYRKSLSNGFISLLLTSNFSPVNLDEGVQNSVSDNNA